MRRASLLHGIAVLLLSAGTAAAQDSGGIGFAPGGVSAANLAQAFAQPPRLPVFASATRRGAPPGAMVTNPGKSRKEFHQQLIAKTRGDAGFLAGFHQGQPLAASRNPPPVVQPSLTFIDAPFIVNNINSALNIALGEGNTTEQGVAANGGGGEILANEPAGNPNAGGAGTTHAGATAVETAPVATASSPPSGPPVSTAHPAPPAPAPTRHTETRPSPLPPSGVTATAPATAQDGPKMPKFPKFPKVPEFPATPALPDVPALPKAPADQPGALMTTLGPLPYLPFAMKNGGVQFNNANSTVNIAAGTGNVATQRVKTIQR